MKVDHGITIPLFKLTGALARYDVLPIFVNCAADPRPSFRRVRAFGEAIGEFLADKDMRITLVGSGGLSHDPPTPRLDMSPPDVARRLIVRQTPTQEELDARESRVIKAARDLVVGKGPCLPPSEQWDRDFLDTFLGRRLEDFDRMTDEEIDRVAGFGAHEVRTWVAAAPPRARWAISRPSCATITWCRNGSPGWASSSGRRLNNTAGTPRSIGADSGGRDHEAACACANRPGNGLALACLAGAQAQDYPNRPITIMVGLGARRHHRHHRRASMPRQASKTIGQRIIIENRQGAGGAVAAAAVQNAAPDGHTLLVFSGSQHAAVPAVQSASLRAGQRVPADHAAVQPRGFRDRAGRQPGQYRQRAAGLRKEEDRRAPVRLAGRRHAVAPARRQDRERDQHADATCALPRRRADDGRSGHRRVDFALASYTVAKGFFVEKKLKAVAVDADARLSVQPDVPTMTEAGLGHVKVASWFALAAPAGTPPPIVREAARRIRQGRAGSRAQAPHDRERHADQHQHAGARWASSWPRRWRPPSSWSTSSG